MEDDDLFLGASRQIRQPVLQATRVAGASGIREEEDEEEEDEVPRRGGNEDWAEGDQQ